MSEAFRWEGPGWYRQRGGGTIRVLRKMPKCDKFGYNIVAVVMGEWNDWELVSFNPRGKVEPPHEEEEDLIGGRIRE